MVFARLIHVEKKSSRTCSELFDMHVQPLFNRISLRHLEHKMQTLHTLGFCFYSILLLLGPMSMNTNYFVKYMSLGIIIFHYSTEAH